MKLILLIFFLGPGGCRCEDYLMGGRRLFCDLTMYVPLSLGLTVGITHSSAILHLYYLACCVGFFHLRGLQLVVEGCSRNEPP